MKSKIIVVCCDVIGKVALFFFSLNASADLIKFTINNDALMIILALFGSRCSINKLITNENVFSALGAYLQIEFIQLEMERLMGAFINRKRTREYIFKMNDIMRMF